MYSRKILCPCCSGAADLKSDNSVRAKKKQRRTPLRTLPTAVAPSLTELAPTVHTHTPAPAPVQSAIGDDATAESAPTRATAAAAFPVPAVSKRKRRRIVCDEDDGTEATAPPSSSLLAAVSVLSAADTETRSTSSSATTSAAAGGLVSTKPNSSIVDSKAAMEVGDSLPPQSPLFVPMMGAASAGDTMRVIASDNSNEAVLLGKSLARACVVPLCYFVSSCGGGCGDPMHQRCKVNRCLLRVLPERGR